MSNPNQDDFFEQFLPIADRATPEDIGHMVLMAEHLLDSAPYQIRRTRDIVSAFGVGYVHVEHIHETDGEHACDEVSVATYSWDQCNEKFNFALGLTYGTSSGLNLGIPGAFGPEEAAALSLRILEPITEEPYDYAFGDLQLVEVLAKIARQVEGEGRVGALQAAGPELLSSATLAASYDSHPDRLTETGTVLDTGEIIRLQRRDIIIEDPHAAIDLSGYCKLRIELGQDHEQPQEFLWFYDGTVFLRQASDDLMPYEKVDELVRRSGLYYPTRQEVSVFDAALSSFCIQEEL